jgi:undecaprenyl-diphosphatase
VLFFAGFLVLFLLLWAATYALLPAVWRGTTFAASAIAGFSLRNARLKRWASGSSRTREYAPIIGIVLAGALATAWIGDGFIDLAERVQANAPQVQRADTESHRWAVQHRESDATLFFTVMTIVGGPAGVGTIVLLAAIALAITRRWRWIAFLAVTCGGAGLLNLELKRFFARARPDVAEMLRRANGYSFPSGHAMGSTVTFLALAYLAFRLSLRWRWKAAALAFAIALIAAVALSRVYLGAHWISDVGAGITAGLAWTGVCTVGYESLRRIHSVRARRVTAPAATVVK